MAKLYLQRHLKSQWNLDNRFAGWTDGPIIKDSNAMAEQFAKEMSGLKIDEAYCSVQFRSMNTISKIYEYIPDSYPMFIHIDGGKMEKWGAFEGGGDYLPVYVTEKLNERHYGRLQGLNKAETIQKYGEEKVHEWRRAYTVAPPGGESMEDTYKRAVPFYKKYIEKELQAGKNIIVVGSHNSLRAIVKYIENISDEAVSNLELPFGSLTKYEFDGKDYSKLQ